MIKIILILLILLVFYKIYTIYFQNTNEPFINITNPFLGSSPNHNLSQFQLGTSIPDESQILSKNTIPLVSNGIKTEYNLAPEFKLKKINSYFIASKFNNDYRDVQTAFNTISPNQKKLFNIQELPVRTTQYKNNYPIEVYKLVVKFINNLNIVIDKLPNNAEIINDYNNYLPMTSQAQSYYKNKGINGFYNNIGIDFNLYPDTPINAPVELINFIDIEKQFTINETKYIISFVLRKKLKSVSDQIKITVHFIMRNNSNNINSENVNSNQPVAIEYIFVDGIFTNKFNSPFDAYGKDSNKKNTPFNDDFYNFDELGKNNLMSDNEIITELNKKFKEHSIDMSNFAINVPYPIYQNPQFSKEPEFV